MADQDEQDFYLRYYVGHKGKFGHEFLEFEFRPDGLFFFSYFFCVVFMKYIIYTNNYCLQRALLYL